MQNIIMKTTLESSRNFMKYNRYAAAFLLKNADKLGPKSRFKLWKEGGVSIGKLKKFLALTFYFGMVQKQNLKSYWS